MHLLGGGSIFGGMLPAGVRAHFRVAMWAAAEHNHWYQPGQFHSEALAAAEAWFITINYCDPVLARYQHIDSCGCPVAVGYAGIRAAISCPAMSTIALKKSTSRTSSAANIIGGPTSIRCIFKIAPATTCSGMS